MPGSFDNQIIHNTIRLIPPIQKGSRNCQSILLDTFFYAIIVEEDKLRQYVNVKVIIQEDCENQ
ncbi:unnamed protein product [Paramecium sonneborni]|uniref:Uncharacterized protein n=1 Tax=Paramecium sonneborni TaxID=65129 RepID=A0A8S1P6W2_9CILI|nr:unnamed protein product [Paramecium sonneborni]